MPNQYIKREPTLLGRFWAKVRKTNTCWLWTGTTNGTYGNFCIGNSKVRYAHRFSWELHNGLIPPGLCVCHHCDTPLCVRPEHLFLGTNADNSRDMGRKGRAAMTLHPEAAAKIAERLRRRITLSQDDIPVIRYLAGRGASHQSIAALFGLDKSTIGYVIRRRTWRNVP